MADPQQEPPWHDSPRHEPMTDEDDPPRLSTGNRGWTISSAAGWTRTASTSSRAGPAPARRRWRCSSCWKASARRTVSTSRSPRPSASCACRRRHGWSLDGVDIFELVPPRPARSRARTDRLPPAEMELERDHPADLRPGRSAQPHPRRLRQPFRAAAAGAELAPLPAADPRAQAFLRQPALHRPSARRSSLEGDDLQLHSIAHGVVLLEQLAIDYGAERRRLRVVKMRGIDFRGGFHDFTIRTGGLEIFPRLVAAEHRRLPRGHASPAATPSWTRCWAAVWSAAPTPALGAAGVGKSSLALTYAIAAAARGERAVIFAFDEGRGTIQSRAADARPAAGRGARGWSASSRSTRRSSRPANSPHRSGARWRSTGPGRRDRQPQRLPQRHAGRALSDPADARAAELPRPAGRADHSRAGAAWAGRTDADAGRPQLPQRCRPDAALLRVRGRSAARCRS